MVNFLKAKGQNKYLMDQYHEILEMLNISKNDLEVLFDANEGWFELQKSMVETNNQINNVTPSCVKYDSFPLHIRRFIEK